MKRWLCLILALALCLGLAGCSSSGGKSDTGREDRPDKTEKLPGEGMGEPVGGEDGPVADVTGPEGETKNPLDGPAASDPENKLDSPPASDPGNKLDAPGEYKEPDPAPDAVPYKKINFGEKQALEFVEITLDGASMAEEIRPDDPQRVFRYWPDKEGEKYVYIYGVIKNVSGDKYEFADSMYAAMTFDGKYNYNASVAADEGGDFSYIYAHLDPLKSEKIYFIASIPDELADTYSQVELKFGFGNNFEAPYNIQEDECDHLFSITITK